MCLSTLTQRNLCVDLMWNISIDGQNKSIDRLIMSFFLLRTIRNHWKKSIQFIYYTFFILNPRAVKHGTHTTKTCTFFSAAYIKQIFRFACIILLQFWYTFETVIFFAISFFSQNLPLLQWISPLVAPVSWDLMLNENAPFSWPDSAKDLSSKKCIQDFW